MRHGSVLCLLCGCLLLGACGQDSGSTKSPPAVGSESDQPAPEGDRFEGSGVLEPLGPSIYMQGSHKLVEGEKILCLLESQTIDLTQHEGHKVKVSGPSRPTTEGNQIIVQVETIENLP